MTPSIAALLIWSAFAPPPDASPPDPNTQQITAAQSRDQRQAKRRFIGSGVLLGLAFVSEMTGAGITFSCWQQQRCNGNLTYTWGNEHGSRFTLLTAGPGSAYVGARLVSAPLVALGGGLLFAGAHSRAYGEAFPSETPIKRRDAWAMFGTGLGVYLASRLTRLGFAIGGVCQVPGCVFAFDQTTLASSRALMLTGGALLMHGRTRDRLRLRLGLGPTTGWGVAIHGQF
jgi:hypothetical protein